MTYNCFASCSFGLEGVVKNELIRLGAADVRGDDARVYFTADDALLMRANLWLRCADRVYILVSEFDARTFDELFCGVKAAWLDGYVGKTCAFPVAGDCVKSMLMSVSDVQAITKKAAADNLLRAHRVPRLPETGGKVGLHIFLLRDRASLCVDTSGAGLNRRGYRTSTTAAPIRETLAAGIVQLSGYRGNGVFMDPMCGSGTIAIEAYLYAKNIAPGLNRSFDMETFGFIDRSVCAAERERARAERRGDEPVIIASDIDAASVKLAKAHAAKAGAHIDISVADAVRDYDSAGGQIVCNPPYAVRMGEQREVRELYRALGERLKASAWRQSYICSDDEFERWYGRRADRKRKLYNGNIRCGLYSYDKRC